VKIESKNDKGEIMFKLLLGILISAGSIPRPLGRRLAKSQRIEERSYYPAACCGVLY
jgi:hypothetical protein